MNNLLYLQQQLTQVEVQLQELRRLGAIAYPANFVLDSSESKVRTYYRRRVREGGKPGKSEQISAELYSQLQCELAKGKQIHKLEKQQSRIVGQLEAIAARISSLGGVVGEVRDKDS